MAGRVRWCAQRLSLALLAATAAACAGTPPAPEMPPPSEVARAGAKSGSPPASNARADLDEADCRAPEQAEPSAEADQPLVTTCESPGRRIRLALDRPSMTLREGRWVVMVAAPAQRLVTIGVAGPVDALRYFDVLAPDPMQRLRAGTVDDDGRLPTFVSLETPPSAEDVAVVVDVAAPVTLMRSVGDPKAIEPPAAKALTVGQAAPRQLVGLPFPLGSRDGYFLQAPPRYLFVRADVAAALRHAFMQTRRRFRGGTIGVGDCSQWDGGRPATDLGKPRHISHVGGRDVDVGLPVTEGKSTLTRRCEGVLVDEGVLKCGPGTVEGLDAMRLAYFLGLLIDGPTPGGRHIANPDRRSGPIAMVETIFTDQAYIDEIRKALPKLRAKRWIHEEAFGALGEEGLLRASPWHVDHVHVRFIGEKAATPETLAFAPSPSYREQDEVAKDRAEAQR